MSKAGIIEKDKKLVTWWRVIQFCYLVLISSIFASVLMLSIFFVFEGGVWGSVGDFLGTAAVLFFFGLILGLILSPGFLLVCAACWMLGGETFLSRPVSLARNQVIFRGGLSAVICTSISALLLFYIDYIFVASLLGGVASLFLAPMTALRIFRPAL